MKICAILISLIMLMSVLDVIKVASLQQAIDLFDVISWFLII